MKLLQNTLSLILALVLFSACGSDSKTALVTLQTGLETQGPSKNLMRGLVNQWDSNSKVGANFCKQNDVLAGFAPSNDNGNDGNISFFKVALATTAASSFTANPDSWLVANSEFPPIGIPAPIGVPLDFGILGSLIAPSNTGLAGEVCPVANAGAINTTYSMIGHAQATISGNTVVPIKVWILQSNNGAPQNPGGDCDSNNGGNGTLAQRCPNKNYFYVKTSAGTNYDAVLTYGFGNNGNPPIKQNVLAADLGAGIRIPEIKPLTIQLMSAGSAVGNLMTVNKSTFGNGIASFDSGFGGPPTTKIEVSEGGGVTVPGATYLNRTITGSGPYTVTLTWNSSYLANSYSVTRYASDCSSSPSSVVTSTSSLTASNISVAAGTYCYKITPSGPGGTGTTTSSVFTVP